MIITSGYNVYPSHIEEIIESHPAVLQCSVVGIPHPYKVTVAKAFVVLKDGVEKNDANNNNHSIISYVLENMDLFEGKEFLSMLEYDQKIMKLG